MDRLADPISRCHLMSPLLGQDRYATSPHGDDDWYGMTLADLRDYVRAFQPAASADLSIATIDGVLTAWAVGPEPVPPGLAVQLLTNNQPEELQTDQHLHFCGAIFARFTEIVQSLAACPQPRSPGDVYDVERKLGGARAPYQPILNLPGDHPEPCAWATGFHQIIQSQGDAWAELMAQHPKYYLWLPHIMYFVPNRRGYPTNKAIRNHRESNVIRYYEHGLAVDVMTLYWHFREARHANELNAMP